MPPGNSLAALVRSTEALARALARDDVVGLATALDARRKAFEGLRAVLGDAPSASSRQALARVARLDTRLVAAAERALDKVRSELRELRETRTALRRLAPGAEPARFVNRRA